MADRPGIEVIGVGPGDPRYLTLRGRELIADAAYVAGFRTVLGAVAEHICGERVELDYRNQSAGLQFLGERADAGDRCVLLAHGDFNFSGGELLALAREHCGPLRLVPGISSIQIACARAGLAMEETLFITLHKRADISADLEELRAAVLAGRRNLILLPRPWDVMPAAIAQNLIASGAAPERPVIVYERLTLEGEAASAFSLSSLAQATREFSDLSILVVPKPSSP